MPGRGLRFEAMAEQLQLLRIGTREPTLAASRAFLPRTSTLAQRSTARLLPARYSDSVLTRLSSRDDDLAAIFALDNATNERLLAEADGRPGVLARELVFDLPYARIINAAFTHPHPLGARFSSPFRGAWYAAFELATAKAEVAFHRAVHFAEIDWREPESLDYDHYQADFAGEFHDLRPLPAPGPQAWPTAGHNAESAPAGQPHLPFTLAGDPTREIERHREGPASDPLSHAPNPWEKSAASGPTREDVAHTPAGTERLQTGSPALAPTTSGGPQSSDGAETHPGERAAWSTSPQSQAGGADSSTDPRTEEHPLGHRFPPQAVLPQHALDREAARLACLAPGSYLASQALALELLHAGSLGVVYPSARRSGGTCLACFRPGAVFNVRKRDLHRLTWYPDQPPVFTRVPRTNSAAGTPQPDR